VRSHGAFVLGLSGANSVRLAAGLRDVGRAGLRWMVGDRRTLPTEAIEELQIFDGDELNLRRLRPQHLPRHRARHKRRPTYLIAALGWDRPPEGAHDGASTTAATSTRAVVRATEASWRRATSPIQGRCCSRRLDDSIAPALRTAEFRRGRSSRSTRLLRRRVRGRDEREVFALMAGRGGAVDEAVTRGNVGGDGPPTGAVSLQGRALL
jgi:hypothetical protein